MSTLNFKTPTPVNFCDINIFKLFNYIFGKNIVNGKRSTNTIKSLKNILKRKKKFVLAQIPEGSEEETSSRFKNSTKNELIDNIIYKFKDQTNQLLSKNSLEDINKKLIQNNKDNLPVVVVNSKNNNRSSTLNNIIDSPKNEKPKYNKIKIKNRLHSVSINPNQPERPKKKQKSSDITHKKDKKVTKYIPLKLSAVKKIATVKKPIYGSKDKNKFIKSLASKQNSKLKKQKIEREKKLKEKNKKRKIAVSKLPKRKDFLKKSNGKINYNLLPKIPRKYVYDIIPYQNIEQITALDPNHAEIGEKVFYKIEENKYTKAYVYMRHYKAQTFDLFVPILDDFVKDVFYTSVKRDPRHDQLPQQDEMHHFLKERAIRKIGYNKQKQYSPLNSRQIELGLNYDRDLGYNKADNLQYNLDQYDIAYNMWERRKPKRHKRIKRDSDLNEQGEKRWNVEEGKVGQKLVFKYKGDLEIGYVYRRNVKNKTVDMLLLMENTIVRNVPESDIEGETFNEREMNESEEEMAKILKINLVKKLFKNNTRELTDLGSRGALSNNLVKFLKLCPRIQIKNTPAIKKLPIVTKQFKEFKLSSSESFPDDEYR